MPRPTCIAAGCLFLAAPSLASDYPPPPGPYTNPAVHEWLAARTEPLLASARLERGTAAEVLVTGSAQKGPPEVGAQLISARADQRPAPGSRKESPAYTPENPETRASGPLAEAATGAGGPGWYAGQPLRWREPVAGPLIQTAAAPGQRAPAPRQGMLDPLPAAAAYSRWSGADLQRPEFTPIEPAGYRSTAELLALYLDYESAARTAEPDNYGQAANLSPAAPSQAPEPESRRYYYRPTGTTFEFRALDTPPGPTQQARNSDPGDWHAPSRRDGGW